METTISQYLKLVDDHKHRELLRQERLDDIFEAGDRQALLDFIAESEAMNTSQDLHWD